MEELVKCLPLSTGSQVQMPRTHIKKNQHVVGGGLGKAETTYWPDSQPSQMSFRFSESLCFKKQRWRHQGGGSAGQSAHNQA